MQAVLSLCFLVATTLACPTSDLKNEISVDKSWPVICPATWKIRTFDSQYATKAFQGAWFVQLATPTSINGLHSLKTGIFSNTYPATSLRLLFRDTTPHTEFDYNTDYYMIDSSFNLATQRIESTKTLFKAAYGSTSPYAIFNVGTPKYYDQTIIESNPFTDDLLIRHQIDDFYQREYSVACIGSDDDWNEYLIFVVLNQYDNIFYGNDNHILWVLTRNSDVDWSTYKKIYDDIKSSGFNPYYLMSIDQSTDFNTIPTITPEDISGDVVIQETSVTSSSSTTTVDGTTISSSSSSTTTTTISTVEFTLAPDYLSNYPYEFDTYDLFGDVKILKNLPADIIKNALSGTYYVNSATPFTIDVDDGRIGLLNNAFPATALQVIFNTLETDWDYTSPVLMLDRGYNMISGEISETKSVVYSTFNGDNPWGVFTVYSEGYYSQTIEEISPLSIEGIVCTKPSDLYTLEYTLGIAGYKQDEFVLLYIANKFKNPFYSTNPVNQFYVLTRDRIVRPETINDINQELLRVGYHPNYLTYIDQTRDITDQYVFDYEYFQVTSTTITSSSSSVSSTTTTSRSLSSGSLGPDSLVPADLGPGSPLLPGDFGPDNLGPNGLGPIDLSPNDLGPNDLGPIDLSPNDLGPIDLSPNDLGPNDLGPIDLGPVDLGPNGLGPVIPSSPLSPGGPISLGSPISGLPTICTSTWQVKTFESSYATNAFHGIWYLQLATPTYINGQHPLRTGIFNNVYPASNLRTIFSDTTPCDSFDYNTDYVVLDSSYNLATQRIETTETLWRSAYGPNSPFAIFNVATPKYYETPIVEKNPLTDDLLIRHELTGVYEREYTIACIGGDSVWNDYLVFVVVNQYDNLYSVNNEPIVWVLSRSSTPDWDIYKKAHDDLLASGINPYNLISIDQSTDLSVIPTVTTDDIDGVITSVTTTSSTTIVNGVTTSSSSTTTISTVEFDLDSTYSIPYDYDIYDQYGGVKILKNLPADVINDALKGTYFVNAATPMSYDSSLAQRVGILNNVFPATGLQALFDSSITQWDYQTPRLLLDRGYNALTGELSQTRSAVFSPYDGNYPWGVFVVYSEGYYSSSIEEISSLPLDGIICSKPSDLYRDQYVIALVGYKQDRYTLLYIENKFKNAFYSSEPENELLVLTRDRVPSLDDIAEINQDLLRIGYNPNHLINIDQTQEITDAFDFTGEYFQIESYSSYSSSSSSVTVTESSSSCSSTIISS